MFNISTCIMDEPDAENPAIQNWFIVRFQKILRHNANACGASYPHFLAVHGVGRPTESMPIIACVSSSRDGVVVIRVGL